MQLSSEEEDDTQERACMCSAAARAREQAWYAMHVAAPETQHSMAYQACHAVLRFRRGKVLAGRTAHPSCAVRAVTRFLGAS